MKKDENLEAGVTEEKFNSVIQSIKKSKSPGPDRWTTEFNLGFYDLLEYDLLRATKETRLSGKVRGALNATFLALIAKCL